MEQILILGGVAAGLSAASHARRLSPGAAITVLERGSEVGYSACGLPYFLARRIQDLATLRVHPTDWWGEQRQLRVLPGHEAVGIEPARHRVRVRHGSGESWFPYDKLVIATGARGRWEPEHTGLRNVFSANTWDQVQELERALQSGGLRRLAVVGGGYIGLETAEALAQRGLEVHLVHAHGDLLRGFEPELTAVLPERLQARGLKLHLGTRVLGLAGARGGRVLGLETASGTLDCDAVVNCGGLRPEVGLAQAAGVALGRTGAIAADERRQTNLAGIYAAGDCSETRHRATGAAVWVPLGAAANKQGRVAGAGAVGQSARFPGVLATLAVPLAGWEWGRTGLSEAEAHAAGLDAAAGQVETHSQANYLDPQPVAVRIVYERHTARLLGAHFRGGPGTVAGRLDTAAAAVAAGMTLEEIEYLDLAYQPALAPLYDALLIAAHNARHRR